MSDYVGSLADVAARLARSYDEGLRDAFQIAAEYHQERRDYFADLVATSNGDAREIWDHFRVTHEISRNEIIKRGELAAKGRT